PARANAASRSARIGERAWIATQVLHVVEDESEVAAEPLGRRVVGGREPAVAVARDESQSAAGAPARNPDRQPLLHGRRLKGISGEQLADPRQRLVEPCAALVERDAGGVVVRVRRAGAESLSPRSDRSDPKSIN